jgi:hypothetical protein
MFEVLGLTGVCGMQINQHFPWRCAADGNRHAFVCIRTADQLTGKAIVTLAMFSLPVVVPEVVCELKSICEDVFEKGILRRFY